MTACVSAIRAALLLLLAGAGAVAIKASPDIMVMQGFTQGHLAGSVTATWAATATTTTTTTTTTSTAFAGCGGVVRCLNDTLCAQCIEAINVTAGFPHSSAEYYSLDTPAVRAYDIGFFQTLQSVESCSTNASPSGIIYPALQELSDVISCADAYRMVVDDCLVPEYACFADYNCRNCLAALHVAANNNNNNNNGSDAGAKKVALLSSACNATPPVLLNNLMGGCGGRSFPECTLVKLGCSTLPECASCLTTLGSGDGAGAARQCPGFMSVSSVRMDNYVEDCFDNSAVACNFWRQRCADDVACSACISGMDNDDSSSAIAIDWSSPACRSVVQPNNAGSLFAATYLTAIAIGCPGISACRNAVTNCVMSYGDKCISCFNGSALPSQATFCSELSISFSIDTACQPCPVPVHTINLIVFATATVGGASAVACFAVVMTIVAHGHDLYMRDRIVLGLILFNAVYSTANAIPLNALRTGGVDCGRFAMSFDAIRFGRAWWFFGKYGLVCFELLILSASIRAMHHDMSGLPPRAEAAMHVACFAIAALAFIVFYVLCASINADGYDASTESEAYTNAYNHASTNDDLDDIEPSFAASSTFENERNAYDNLVRHMLVAWNVLVGVAVGLWVWLRALHLHALRALRTETAAAAQAEAADEWGETRRSVWEARQHLLKARKQAFNEVAKPLEPYIAVFLLFAAPAFVMSTRFCQTHSDASATGGQSVGNVGDGESTNFSYGTCDVWCEFVLAFRSLSAVAVYLAPSERRAEIVAVRSTWRKLCTRVFECIHQAPYARSTTTHGHEIEMNALDQQPDENNTDDSTVAVVVGTATDASSWHINESDITMVRRLGTGAFGEVWDCTLQPNGSRVAVKILFSGAVDEDGDLINTNADEDLHKECAALQTVNSLYLLKFYGFGITKKGNGFIVTELMLGGSLEDVLHDHDRNLQWRTRVAISLQVALGMEHLHKKNMLHRDLKSANVLLDEEFKHAKVCDFGLSRVMRPAPQHVVVRSSFTGVTRLLPSVQGIEIHDDGPSSVMSMARIAVSFSDARGTMTKAAGTLLWMAPEVFRGDQSYTGAVDVYSFGIVMWELATRETPWVEELPSKQAQFFETINSALQTGRRPTIPEAVCAEHGAFVSVMQRCWASDPINRPPFSEAASDLATCLRGTA
jgi:hypothetical protein